MQIGLVTVVAVSIGGLSVTTAYGQAQSNTVRVSTPFETSGIPICGVEQVFFSGILNFVFHKTIRPNGEYTYSFSHTNFQKITAISESGERYVVKDVNNQSLFTIQNGDNEFITFAHGVSIDTGQGINGPNIIASFVFRFIIHPDGETTIELEDVDIKCVG